ncbi:hypothetical protein CC1G_05637 [Coprinopsis cinerea okayama7|uniref:F-box domain-containing protein n=1 Tax=Coprinopsis cinerea (strain Okayama-7 / 130 / ATCC MYA-4618 / FGSC 9003) TaxID=240176 RepID=A8P1R0_COPC7|nr:hypothetical protein CC1G_05637 [Coprinopsis cinerea okayama7\|eukprot:XP_001838156.2 hypothetical protein CC1G_05637 [Coprinopsis cinerea okayama7\
MQFTALTDDILFLILSFLTPPELLGIRQKLSQTCTRLARLSRERTVWVTACQGFVLSNEYPFPRGQPLDSIPLEDLERYTIQGYRLAEIWGRRDDVTKPIGFQSVVNLEGHSGSAVSEVHFLPMKDMLLTVSKSVWVVMTVWQIGAVGNPDPVKLCEWSPRGALFQGLAVNSDPTSPATLAVSVIDRSNEHHAHVLSLNQESQSTWALTTLVSFQTHFIPLTLEGNQVALCDDSSQTAIWDWSTSEYATLDEDLRETDSEEPPALQSMWTHNVASQVLFTLDSVLVVRARSLCLFPCPKLAESNDPVATSAGPLARHSFGWLDGVTVSPQTSTRGNTTSYNILLRAESDDPWQPPDAHTLCVYTLDVNPDYLVSGSTDSTPSLDSVEGAATPPPLLPYIFPPRYQTKIPTSRGALRCPSLRLGSCGTAVWVKPGESVGSATGLVQMPCHQDPFFNNGYTDDDYAVPMPISFARPFKGRGKECLMAAVLPSSSLYHHSKASTANQTSPVMLMSNQDLQDWTCLDYDEATGRIALGKGDGHTLLLSL